MFISRRLYNQMLDIIEELETTNADLEEENEDLTSRLAHTEGGYYLTDAKEWAAKYHEMTRAYQEEAAKVYGLGLKVEYLESTLEEYRKLLKLVPDTGKKEFNRNPENGQFTGEPVRDESAGFPDQEEPEEGEPVQRVVLTKQMRAYILSERGAAKEVIADQLGIGKQSVRSYVSKGRKEMEETFVDVVKYTEAGCEGKRVSIIEVDVSGCWLTDPEYAANIEYVAA